MVGRTSLGRRIRALAIGLSLACGAMANEVIDADTLRSGLTTSPKLNRAPCGYRVTWINHDSGFRGSGLAIGDFVSAIDGEAIACPPPLTGIEDQAATQAHQRMTQRGLGGVNEHLAWRERALRDGAPLKLSVTRRASKGAGVEKLDISGQLRAARTYTNANNRSALANDGPVNLERDGFTSTWSSWYEDFVRQAERVLDGGWQKRMDNRMLLADALKLRERVELLEKKYPGTFAKTVREDWDKLHASLRGTAYKITDADLEYRKLGEIRAKQISAAAATAHAAWLKALERETIPAFPTADPAAGESKTHAGKVVVLPPIGQDDWVMEATGCALRSGTPKTGHYFIACNHPATRRLFDAQYRYQRLVNPKVDERYSIVGRIVEIPKMMMVGGNATPGLQLEPIIAVVGNQQMAIDLRVNNEGKSPFAGEEQISASAQSAPGPEASPRQVMETFIHALKWSDEALWRSLFATWSVTVDESGASFNSQYGLPNSLSEDWVRSRRLILDSVLDVRVAYEGEIQRVMTGKEFKDAPVIDQVSVELDHIGRFDDGHYAFINSNVHRVWRLQRINNEAWRIVSHQGI